MQSPCGAIQSKCWGTTQCVYTGFYSEVHFLIINRGGYCSKHKHINKWNRFYVIDGKLEVTIYQNGGLEDKTILTANTFSDVPPGVFHRFLCLEDCRCNEIYWTNALDPNDILRETQGGIYPFCGVKTPTS